MTNAPKFCPVCYTDLTKEKAEKTRFGRAIKCPKCKSVCIAEPEKTYIRCPKCQRLFSDQTSYTDHLVKGKCLFKKVVCYG
jgi:uncharacterized C2H2 Zn-finger protein